MRRGLSKFKFRWRITAPPSVLCFQTMKVFICFFNTVSRSNSSVCLQRLKRYDTMKWVGTFGPAKPANPGSPGSQSHSVGPSFPSAASSPDSSEESVSGPAGGYSYGTWNTTILHHGECENKHSWCIFSDIKTTKSGRQCDACVGFFNQLVLLNCYFETVLERCS